MSVLIRKAGILTTVQDLGRNGFRRFGINPGGPMDPAAARVANILAGNDDDAAFLELHFPAGEIAFEKETIFAICGADLGAELDREKVRLWTSQRADAGSILRFTTKLTGERAYLAVEGGIDVPSWLGSRSTNLTAGVGGLKGRALAAGDRLPISGGRTSASTAGLIAAPSLLPRYSRFPTVRVLAGPEFDGIDDANKKALFGGTFTVTVRSDRMGFRLSGEPLALTDPGQLVSSATTFGTIQLLPDGQLIVLMADHQTAGGYPRIAHVISRDLPLLGQLGPGDRLAFHLVGIGEAQRLVAELERELSFLRSACRLAYK